MLRKLLLLGVLIGFVAITWLVKRISLILFPVTTIVCVVPNEPCPKILVNSLNSLKGRSLFFTDFEKNLTAQQLSFYQLALLRKKIPGTLILEFTASQKNYVIYLPDSTRWLVATSGAVRDNPTTENLPLIKISSHWPNPIQNNSLEPALHQLISNLLTSLEANQVSFGQIDLQSPDEVIVHLINGKRAVLSAGQVDTQVQKLGIILRNLDLATIDVSLSTIDLRFNLPVLKI